jgi:hypothetical protein
VALRGDEVTLNGFLDLTWNLMVAAVVVGLVYLTIAVVYSGIREREG